MHTADVSAKTPNAAMIFAAGFGTRMGDLTKDTPKPMLKLGGRPMIDRSVDLLRSAGINRIVANTHYLHDKIAPHLKRIGVENSHEQGQILDTGGGLRLAHPLLGQGPVVTLNPDAGWNGPNPIQTLLSAWRPEFRALLLVVPVARALARKTPGDFSFESGTLRRRGGFVYTGAQIIDQSLLESVPEEVFSLNRIWDILIEDNALQGVSYAGQWCDIGHAEGLSIAEKMLAQDDV